MKTSRKKRELILLAISSLVILHLLLTLITIPPFTLFIVWTAYLILSMLVKEHIPVAYFSLVTCTALCTDTVTKIVLLVLFCLISYKLAKSKIEVYSKVVSITMQLFLIGIIVCVSNISEFVNVLASIGLIIAYLELWKESLPDVMPDDTPRGY